MRDDHGYRCELDEEHAFHGLPKTGCPGPFPAPRKIPERVECLRCSTGFPAPHACAEGLEAAKQRERHETQGETVRDDAGRQPPSGPVSAPGAVFVAPVGTEDWEYVGYITEGGLTLHG